VDAAMNAKTEHPEKITDKESPCDQSIITKEENFTEFNIFALAENRFFHINKIIDQLNGLKNHIASINYNLEFFKLYNQKSLTCNKKELCSITSEIDNAIVESENSLACILKKIFKIEKFYQKNELTKSDFYIKNTLYTTVNYVKTIYNNIDIDVDIDNNYNINGYESLFRDAIFTIIQNTIPYKYEKKVNDKIFFKVNKNNNNLIINMHFSISCYTKRNEFFSEKNIINFNNNLIKDIIVIKHRGYIYSTRKKNKPYITITIPMPEINHDEI
jgi:hypothetical protein